MSLYLPDYAKRFEIASLGLYGHNILSAGDTSPSGSSYVAVQGISDCTISYTVNFPVGNNSDATVTGLAIAAGATVVLGCVKDIVVAGTDGKILAQLISIT
tara:strand:- start:5371 stop:5673 length:303 start_codon:yes stop_codon:yes gene_type:complete